MRADKRVAFRMSDDERESQRLQALQGLFCSGWNSEIGELYKQVSPLIDRVVRRAGANLFEVLHAEVKIATRCELQPVTQLGLQLVAPVAHDVEIKAKFAIGVRRRYDVRNAVLDGHFSHFQRFLERFRAVVECRQDMAVDVHHGVSSEIQDIRVSPTSQRHVANVTTVRGPIRDKAAYP